MLLGSFVIRATRRELVTRPTIDLGGLTKPTACSNPYLSFQIPVDGESWSFALGNPLRIRANRLTKLLLG